MKNLLRALRFFRPDTPRIAWVLALLVLSTGANLLKPWPLALMVDSVLGTKAWPGALAGWLGGLSKPVALAILGGAILLFHALQGALAAAASYASINVGLRGLARVRNELFAWLQRLSLRFYHGTNAGDVIYRATWDTYAFQTLFQQGLITLTTATLALVAMVVVMWRLNRQLTLVAVALVPLLVAVIQGFGRWMSRRTLAAQQADSRVASRVEQGIAAVAVTQSYTREVDAARRFNTQSEEARDRRLAQHGAEVWYGLTIALVFGVGGGGIAWLGAGQVLAGQLTIGRLLVFLAYLAQLYDPLNQLSYVGATVSNAGAGTRRVFELLDTPEEIKESIPARPVRSVSGGTNARADLPAAVREPVEGSEARSASDAVVVAEPLMVRGAIGFEHVSFGYRPDQAVLNDVCFALAPGESLAVIGPSGAGKSTLLHLLPRFFDPTAGAVHLEGVDLRRLRLRDLRQQVALVPQEPILLPATVAENIAYGRPDASAAEIEAAARAAQADGFIRRLPRQYETQVGEGAVRLSVGEKQRISLARAFVKGAPVLVLDEPTSALDAESEALIVASLEKLMRGRTTLLVTHRRAMIDRAAKVLVLREGRVIEFGSPAELLARGGYFAKLAVAGTGVC